MSNRPSTRPSASAAKRAAQQHRSRKTGWIVGGILAVVVVATAVIAIVASSGGSGVAEGIEQTRPVQVSGTALPKLADPASDPAIGVQAPTLTGQSFDGTPVTIEPGKPTLVVFAAHWCPHCRREIPLLVLWNIDGGVPAGLQVVGVATGTDKTLTNFPPSSWLEQEHFPWPVMADDAAGTAAGAFGLPGYPYFVLLDASGKVVWRGSGEIPTSDLTATITTTLGL